MAGLAPHFPACDAGRRQVHAIDSPGDIAGAEALLGGARDAVVRDVRGRGYSVVRGFLTAAEVAEAKVQISRDIEDWVDKAAAASTTASASTGGGLPPYVDMDPQVQSGELQPASPELGVRRLFRLSRNNEHFAQLALRDRRTTEVAQWFCGADVKLVQSLALLKPPGTGEKRWHQDQGVFRIATAGDSIILGFWIALDRATPHNGCMHFWPHSQTKGIVKHGVPIPEEERGPGAHIYYSVLDVPPPEETVAVPLEPGDCLIFDVQTVHGTPSNTTAERRRSIQLQYASAASQPTRCPDAKERPDLTIIEEYGRVLKHDPSEEEILPREQRPVTQWYDCDDARTCTEPQHWSFRKAEALVCGRDYGPQFI